MIRSMLAILNACAKRYGIRVYRFVNVGNHLHLLVKCQARAYSNAKKDFQSFTREFAGAVAFDPFADDLAGAMSGAPG